MTPLIAEFLCLKCNLKYEHEPRITTCPKCGHNYIKWLNYEDYDWLKGKIK